MRRNRARTLIAALLVPLALLGMSGCLVSEAIVRVFYDAGRDEFRQIVVFERFRYRPDAAVQAAGEPGKPPKPYDWTKDYTELKNLYAARAQTIFFEPGPARLFGMVGKVVRTADGKLAEPWEPVAGEPPINFNDVVIKPGELFTDADGYLGYSHEMTMPGKFVDASLKLAVFHFLRDPSNHKRLADEIARRDAGGARLAWKDLIERTAVEVRKRAAGPGAEEAPADKPAEPAPAEGQPDKDNLLCYLDATSLKALQKTLADGTLDVGRRKQKLYARLPLSANDAKNAVELWDVARKEALTARPGERAEIAEVRRKVREAADQGITVEATAAGGLEVTFDIPVVINGTSEAIRAAAAQGFKDAPEDQARAKEMAEQAAKELPVKKGVSVERLLADFSKGGAK
jgi:hypothetical protein